MASPSPAHQSPSSPPPSAAAPGHLQLFLGMQQVALSSFGGGLSAWSERIVVQQRRWLDTQAFLTGLTVARLLPGSNQINLEVYIGSRFHGWSGALAALTGMLLLPFSLLLLFGLAYFELHELPAVDRLLAGVVTASAGMALSMGFKIAGAYSRDPVALLLAAVSFLAMTVFHVRLVPLVLVLAPVAMAWYWPRSPRA